MIYLVSYKRTPIHDCLDFTDASTCVYICACMCVYMFCNAHDALSIEVDLAVYMYACMRVGMFCNAHDPPPPPSIEVDPAGHATLLFLPNIDKLPTPMYP